MLRQVLPGWRWLPRGLAVLCQALPGWRWVSRGLAVLCWLALDLRQSLRSCRAARLACEVLALAMLCQALPRWRWSFTSR